jgi:hypothetical protein
MGLSIYFRSLHETNLQTSEIIYYILPIVVWSDVQKSHFQIARMLKMNISKHTAKKVLYNSRIERNSPELNLYVTRIFKLLSGQ